MRALWTLSFDEGNQKTMIGGDDDVIELFLEMKDSTDSKIKKSCNGALWNMRTKLLESQKYQNAGMFFHIVKVKSRIDFSTC